MRVLDYLRLGVAGIMAHKRHALTVVTVVGLLFGILMAGVLILQGTEDAVMTTMLDITDGKVYVTTSVDVAICENECDFEAGIFEIEENVVDYGGAVLEAGYLNTMDGVFIELTSPMLGLEPGREDKVVSVPLEKAAMLSGIELPEDDASGADKIQAMQEITTKTRGQAINSLTKYPNYQPKPGTEEDYLYYIAGFLPSGFKTGNLALSNVTGRNNTLDLLFGGIETGTSQNLLYDDGKIETNLTEAGMILAEFPDLEKAIAYYYDEANYCSEIDYVFNHCKSQYRYKVTSVISNPVGAYEYFKTAWIVLGVAIAVLIIVAVFIAIGTYSRLISKDAKVISLYYATGATRWQVRIIYFVYLILLSLMAALFALGLGYGLAFLVSILNADTLSQVFMLGFGLVEQKTVWLVGWNERILMMLGVILLTSVLTVIFSMKQLSNRMGKLNRG